MALFSSTLPPAKLGLFCKGCIDPGLCEELSSCKLSACAVNNQAQQPQETVMKLPTLKPISIFIPHGAMDYFNALEQARSMLNAASLGYSAADLHAQMTVAQTLAHAANTVTAIVMLALEQEGGTWLHLTCERRGNGRNIVTASTVPGNSPA